jgi:hypothetical protein
VRDDAVGDGVPEARACAETRQDGHGVWVKRATVARLEAEAGEEEVEGVAVVAMPGSAGQMRLFHVDALGEPLEMRLFLRVEPTFRTVYFRFAGEALLEIV